ncbi:MAG: sortase, partial [Lapillicoccus sp.]
PTTPTTPPRAPGPTPGDGTPAPARLSIPDLALAGLVVEPYVGRTDDAPGTRIQDRGRAASPHGPEGGTGPGGVGSYQVTAHRTSANAPFRDLPALGEGALVHVDAGGVRYTYAVTQTRQTSFRSAASLAEQRAAVPGRPGVAPTEAVILLSTCATPEDHAAGNVWADELHNPEHRIDKIGVLVATAPAPAV